MEQIRTKEITIDDTNAVKGIAILLLLFHHLFFQNKGLYIDYYFSNIPIVQIIGSICKVCVALFVLLSGYGLTKSWNHKMPKLPSFYLKHCTKLFLNYWFWWIVFVPIGFIWFGYTWTGVYGNDFTALRGIIDGIGLAAACHTPTINPTWWFYSCILILYLIFPLIYHLAKNKWWAIAMVVMSALFFRMNFVKFLSPVQGYLLVFVCGVIFAQHNLFDWLNKQRWNNTIMAILFVIVFALLRAFWPFSIIVDHSFVDFLFAISIVNLYLNKNKTNGINRTLEFCGKHSFNIFLFHTFIFYLYFQSFIYWSKNPLLIFMTLIVVTLAISFAAEWLKERIGFYKLQNKIGNLLK